MSIGIGLFAACVIVFCCHWFYLRSSRIAAVKQVKWSARQLGKAAQQYFIESGQSVVSFSYNPSTGRITGDLTPWVYAIDKDFEFIDTTIESGNEAAFSFRYRGGFGDQILYISDTGYAESLEGEPSFIRGY